MSVILTFDIQTYPDYSEKIYNHIFQNVVGDKEITPELINEIQDEELKREIKQRLQTELSTNPFSAKIIAIGYKINNEESDSLVIKEGFSEKEMLQKFWKVNQLIFDYQKSKPIYVTKGGKYFDLPFLVIRSMITGVPTPRWLSYSMDEYLNNYKKFPHFDINMIFRNYSKILPLNLMAESFGIRIDLVESKEFQNMFERGETDSIRQYCKNSVTAIYQIYKIAKEYFS